MTAALLLAPSRADSSLDRPLPVVEIYGPVMQGEGMLIGVPTVFVRLGGCDFACSWCDSMYAVDVKQYKHQWTRMAPLAIVERVASLVRGPIMVTLSGGNPALHNCASLIDYLHLAGHRIAVETQGTIAPTWFSRVDHLVLSPKPPSSLMPYDAGALRLCLDRADTLLTIVTLKIVVFDDADYAFALGVHHAFPSLPCVLQLGTPQGVPVDRDSMLERLDHWQQRVIADGHYQVRVLPQLHAIIKGHARGV